MNYLQKIQKAYRCPEENRALYGCGKCVGDFQSVCEGTLPYEDKGVLYLCDHPKTAGYLAKRELPVLAVLHEGNKNQEFPGIKYAVEKPDEADEEYFERIYRRLKGLPWDILETERCLIRETVEEDVEAFYEIYSHPQITKFMENLYPEPEQEKQYVREYIEKVYSFYEFGIWTVTEKVSGEVIGRAGFYYREGFENPELGFVIGVPWQGKGIAKEVCSAVLQYGREALAFEKVNAMVHPENTVSLNLCRSLGFKERETVMLEGGSYLRMEKFSFL